MKLFTFTKLGRTLLLSVAVIAFGLTGCGDNGANSSEGGGGSIVGDWLLYSDKRLPNGETGYASDDQDHKLVVTFKSSGEYVTVPFSKEVNVWEESDGVSGVWSVNGSTLEVTKKGSSKSARGPYQVSGNRLTFTGCYSGDDCTEQVFTRVKLADLRRSLGL